MKLTPKVIFFMVLDFLVILIGFAVPWYRFSVPMLSFEASTSLFLIPFHISNLIVFFESDVFTTVNVDTSSVISELNTMRFVSILPYVIIIFIAIAFILLFIKNDKKRYYLFSAIAMGGVLLTSLVGLIINHSFQQGVREALSSIDSFEIGAITSNIFYVGFAAGFYLLIVAALVLLFVPLICKHFGDALPESLAAIGTDIEDDNINSISSNHKQEADYSDRYHFSSAEPQNDFRPPQNNRSVLAARQAETTSEADEPEIASLSGDDGTYFSIRRLPFTIGRDIDQVDGLFSQSFVSRQHCRFERQNEQISLVDLNSTHGTFINHEKLPPNEQFYVLSGDVITIGKIDMTLDIKPMSNTSSPIDDSSISKNSQYHTPLPDAEEDDDVTRLQVMGESTAYTEDEDDDELTTVQTFSDESLSEKEREEGKPLEAPSPQEAENMSSNGEAHDEANSDGETFKINFADRRCLVCVTPDIEEEPCVITACPFRIGRNGDEVDYAIASNSVSRSHLMITKDEHTYYVTDLHASNRVKINGDPISPGIEIPIEIGDVISIGNREYRFEKV